jgi:hemerythrin-like domain-containing protein
MPIGPLMIEHRLIERMIRIAKIELERLTSGKTPDPAFIDVAVDFIRTYADRCHHGKEEDILFRDLAKKGLSDEHKRIMDELIAEHVQGRKKTRALSEAKERYLKMNGDDNAVTDVIEAISWLVNFYPVHIEKEDRHFFMPVMSYFTKQEQNAMLQEMYEFDKNLIHSVYGGVVERLESK